jgi:hypothetical protein
MTDTAIRTLEYEAGVRDQELADLRLRVVQLESAAGFVVRRAELATSESLRERIEALGKVLDSEEASTLSRGDGFRHFANELIDAIATPKGRDFRHAWDEACLFFGRFGAEPTLFNLLLRFAEATRLYVVDKDEDRVQTWNNMIDALDAALEVFPERDGPTRCTGYADTIGGGSQVRCGDVEGHEGAHRHRRAGEWEPAPMPPSSNPEDSKR